MRFLLFELKKTLFSKRFFYLLLTIMMIVLGLFVRNFFSQPYIHEEQEQTIIREIQYGQKLMRKYELILVNKPEDKRTKDLLIKASSFVDTLYELRKSLPSSDWKQRLSLEKDYLSKVQEFKQIGGEFPLSSMEIEERMITLKHLLAKNIPPESADYSIAPPNFMKQTIDLLASGGLLIFLILTIGDTFTSEYESRSLHFLFTQPLKKGTIVHAKIGSSLIVMIVFLVVPLFVAWLVSNLFGSSGTFDYPIYIVDEIGPAFLPLHQYIPALFTLTITTAILTIGIIFLFSVILRHTVPTLFAVVILLGVGVTFTQFSLIPAIINPFQYVMPIASLLDQTITPWWTSIFASLSVFLACYFAVVLCIGRMKLN